MYHSYFGLDEQAFSIAVNPRYLYMSAQHREALAHLLYGVSSGGFVMLTGEVGTGKTTIIRCLLEQLPENADLAIVMNPSASARDLLCSICDEFGVDYAPDETSHKVLTDKLTEFLVANHRRERKTIVLIDEAQLLRISTLEQVRLLTNLETNTQKLLQIILVGQPELNDLLATPALRQLSQRITARYHLRPLSEPETEAYIRHRLIIAGMSPGHQPFPTPIVRKVHQISRGIPRLVNVLCDRMLLGAYSRDTNQIDTQICRQATIEVFGSAPKETFRRYQSWIYVGIASLATLVLMLIIWLLEGAHSAPSAAGVSVPIAQGSIVRSSVITDRAESGSKIVGGKLVGSKIVPISALNESNWLRSQDHAVTELLGALDLKFDSELYPCWEIARQGYKCETQSVSSFEDFRSFNRPAVLKITTPSHDSAYVALVGIKANDAWVRAHGKVLRVTVAELQGAWSGEFTFVWHRPDAFKGPIGLGTRGPLVTWLAQQFAVLDKQNAPLTQEHFNAALQQRVQIFQRQQGLPDDGFVGMRTILKLNEALGLEKSLSDLEVSLSTTGS